MKNTFTLLIFLLATLAFTAQTRIYKGSSTSTFDCIYTYSEGEVYKGKSTSTFDCIMTVDGMAPYELIAVLAKLNY
jgi:hypothetical protein